MKYVFFATLLLVLSNHLVAQNGTEREISLYEAEMLVKKGDAQFLDQKENKTHPLTFVTTTTNEPTAEKMPPKTSIQATSTKEPAQIETNKAIAIVDKTTIVHPKPQLTETPQKSVIKAQEPVILTSYTDTFNDKPTTTKTPEESVVSLLESSIQNIDEIILQLDLAYSSTALNKKRMSAELKKVQNLYSEQLKALKTLEGK